nr:uncharacterized protein LOC126518221 [Dermacentor andersoni]
MVRDRLSEYLENKRVFADSMYGFRPNKSAQDILLQLSREVLNPIEHPNGDKIVLALDLKGAFDNVTHEAILTHLSETGCGRNAFEYIKRFLTDRQAYVRIQNAEHGPFLLGTRGTPQGAVLSPLLFNLAMKNLPVHLEKVPGVQHALYADDISIWATQGSLGEMEASLQEAANAANEYAKRCGLHCSPQKSEFVHIRPNKKCTNKIELRLGSAPIPERKEIRVLGLFIHQRRLATTTLDKLKKVGDQVGRMVRRVSNKKGGLRSKDALRLANAFVTSRILYSTPYLRLNKHDQNIIEVIIRKMAKKALDLPITTSNLRLQGLGMTNSFDELREAHLTGQYTRLSQTSSGRRLLTRLHIEHTTLTEERVRLSQEWRYALHVRPLPIKMSRDDHEGRRRARAEALAHHYGRKPGVYYVDASGPHHGGWYTAAVIHESKTVNGLTFKARSVTQAEEVAIALAATHSDSKTIITDSQGACRNVQQGWVPYLAYRLLQNSSYVGGPSHRFIVWAPAHSGLGGNEAADAAARALSNRATSSPASSEEVAEATPTYTYKEITQLYKDRHKLYPHPCKGLTRAEERLFLRLVTNTMMCPASLKHFDPAFSGECPHCGERSSDLYHMVWACPSNPAFTPHPNPTREDWEATLLACCDLKAQKAMVKRAMAAAEATGVPY